MRPARNPQSRFLLSAVAAFALLLPAWWFLMMGPLLAWARLSTDVVLNAVPGAPLKTGVAAPERGVWAIQAPVKVAGVWRNVRVETGERLPRQLTVCFPLFWAILFAAGEWRTSWRGWIGGTALLLAIPPAGLLLYTAHVVQIYVFPGAAAWSRAGLAAADYVASTVAPYVAPVLLAVAVHPGLRRRVLAMDRS